jgi:hypothetical protein
MIMCWKSLLQRDAMQLSLTISVILMAFEQYNQSLNLARLRKATPRQARQAKNTHPAWRDTDNISHMALFISVVID